MNRKNFSIGLFLVLIGIMFLLYNMNIMSINIFLILIGLSSLFIYFFTESKINIIIGLVFNAIGGIRIINEFVANHIDIRIGLYGLIIAGVLYYIYRKKRNPIFLIFMNISAAIAVTSLINRFSMDKIDMNFNWLAFFLMAIGMYLIYLFIYKRFGVIWPRYISYILLGIGIIYLGFSIDLAKMFHIRFIIPIIVILIGGGIIYKTMKTQIE